MNRVKHAPTPWHEDVGSIFSAHGEDQMSICDMALIGTSISEQNYADAAFIVQACNAHYALVAALRTIASQSVGSDWAPEQAIAFVRQHAKAALAAAGSV